MASLSEDQKKVKTLIKKGFSIFVTGKGGSGKSFLLKNIIKNLSGNCHGLFVMGSTGVNNSQIFRYWNRNKVCS